MEDIASTTIPDGDETTRARRYLSTRLVDAMIGPDEGDSVYRSSTPSTFGGLFDTLVIFRPLLVLMGLVVTAPVDYVRRRIDPEASWS